MFVDEPLHRNDRDRQMSPAQIYVPQFSRETRSCWFWKRWRYNEKPPFQDNVFLCFSSPPPLSTTSLFPFSPGKKEHAHIMQYLKDVWNFINLHFLSLFQTAHSRTIFIILKTPGFLLLLNRTQHFTWIYIHNLTSLIRFRHSSSLYIWVNV